MDDIRRQDLKLFAKELLSPWRLLLLIVGFGIAASRVSSGGGGGFLTFLFAGFGIVALFVGANAWTESVRKRFSSKRHEALWNACSDRLARFEEVLAKMRRDQVADLHEMPRTIRRVAQSLYAALRRADTIASEVLKTEKGMYAQAPSWSASPSDPQSKELYQIADKNIAEYRQQFAGVMAGVQRTEAQSAVFMTTLDTLRMKMLGYRLVGRGPELSSMDFLNALAEAKTQLQAIDTALEELDLGAYPVSIAAVKPGPAASARGATTPPPFLGTMPKGPSDETEDQQASH